MWITFCKKGQKTRSFAAVQSRYVQKSAECGVDIRKKYCYNNLTACAEAKLRMPERSLKHALLALPQCEKRKQTFGLYGYAIIASRRLPEVLHLMRPVNFAPMWRGVRGV